MSTYGERHLDSSIRNELTKPAIDLRRLAVGSVVDVVLAEGEDCMDQARLSLGLLKGPEPSMGARFEVIKAVVDEVLVRKNAAVGMPDPERMGGIVVVDFSGTYRRGNTPPWTMVQQDAIVPGRSLMAKIPVPSASNPDQGMIWVTEVLDAQVVSVPTL